MGLQGAPKPTCLCVLANPRSGPTKKILPLDEPWPLSWHGGKPAHWDERGVIFFWRDAAHLWAFWGVELGGFSFAHKGLESRLPHRAGKGPQASPQTQKHKRNAPFTDSNRAPPLFLAASGSFDVAKSLKIMRNGPFG